MTVNRDKDKKETPWVQKAQIYNYIQNNRKTS